ncbi:glutamate receptor 3.3 [Perilla frutescens var. frutescens]|nr:glutamate receptor 3.3 [Perilla frutescens var. frutescens]
MKVFWCFIILAFFTTDYHSFGVHTSRSSRPDVVNIGSILTFDSVIGKVAKVAMEAAVDDVNSNSDLLRGTKLNITMCNTNFSGFSGIIQAIHFMEAENVAIIGPQSAVTARVLSHLADELHIPLLSFSATDPTLSPLQFPYFVRTGVNDLFQMAAIADMIKYYGWKDVIAVFVDDDYGRNGLAILADQLAARSCQISDRAPLKPDAGLDDIRNALVEVALASSRILVVHTYPEKGLDIMNTAHYLGMMQQGYVWIATNWLSTVLDTNHPLSSQATNNIQGVLTLRVHTPNTETKKSFVSRWRSLTAREAVHNTPIGLSTYGLYAYDTVWMVACAIDAFLNTSGGNISFTSYARLKGMRIFNGGEAMLSSILNVNTSGVTGTLRFTSHRDLIDPAFEIINVVGSGLRRTGYWSNSSGLSVVLSKKSCCSEPRLHPPIWPGETAVQPRGWVYPNNGRQLRIGVPIRVSFQEFVGRVAGEHDMYTGYCIDVFTAAMSLLPYAVPYQLIPYGDGHNNPSSTDLIRLIAAGEYDAAIGDIAITTDRTRMADFTQPYVESGLVVVAPIRKLPSTAWAFLQPFTTKMWCVTGIFFLIGGAIVWIVEHRINDDFRGPPRKQLVTIIWFSFSTLFYSHKRTVSCLGRFILPVWLFAIFIIKSSYTASLTSILTVQQLSSPIKGIQTLMEGDDPIGYQQGSFARDYLVEQLGIKEARLLPLNMPEDYARALDRGPARGGVVAVVDERVYAELFLSTRCEFTIVGREFTKNGWGFAFAKESELAIDMSTAILRVSENGDLKRIHDKWLLRSACSSQGAKLQEDRLRLSSFEGLFLICGLACVAAFLLYFINIIRQYNHHHHHHTTTSTPTTSRRLHTFFSFADDKEDSVKENTESPSSSTL